MLNVYKKYNNPEELDRYALHKGMKLLDMSVYWEDFDSSQIDDLESVKHIIMKDPRLAYSYAVKLLRHRFPEGESAIMKDPDLAYLYARLIIKERWPEAEKYIMKDQYAWRDYKNAFGIEE